MRAAAFFLRRKCLFVAVLGAAGMVMSCSPSRFPVIRPSVKADHDAMARAKAEELFITARDVERRGRYQEARRLYAMAYKLDPSSRELMELVVRNLVNDGNFERALSIVQKGKDTAALTDEDRRIIAGICWKMGNFQKAVEATEKIKVKEESDWYSLGMMHEAMGNAAKALPCYRKYYMESDGSFGLALKIIRMQIALKQFAAAETLSVITGDRHGEKAELHDLRGILALAQGDTAAALDCFGRAMAVDSMYEPALRNAAMVYLARNDYRHAIVLYESLYRNSSGGNSTVYGRTLAMLYYYGGRYADAEGLMTVLAEHFIGDADFHLFLGRTFAALGEQHKARTEIEKAIVLRKDNSDAWRELVYLSLREKDYGRALETAERYTARFPDDVASLRLYGYVLCQMKQFDRAIPFYEKAVHCDSADAGGWFELGSCYERSGDIVRAVGAFRKVLQLRPEDPVTSNYLGYMWAEKGMHLDSAKVLIESALAKEPANGAFLDSYAWIFYQRGDMENAYRYIVEAIARIHNDPVVFEHVGDILHRRNDLEGALKAYRRSLEYRSEDSGSVRGKIIRLEQVQFQKRNGG